MIEKIIHILTEWILEIWKNDEGENILGKIDYIN